MRIATANEIDTATLTLGNWAASLPLDNLKVRQVSMPARTTSAATSDTVFQADLGAAKTLNVVHLAECNLRDTAQWRVRGGSDSNLSTVLYDSGWTVVSDGKNPVLYPNDVQARYWRVEIDDAGNPDGYVQIGRLFMGNAVLLQYDEDRIDLTHSEYGYRSKSVNGDLYATPFSTHRVLTIDIGWVKEFDELWKQLAALPAYGECFVECRLASGLGTLVRRPVISEVTPGELWQTTINIEMVN